MSYTSIPEEKGLAELLCNFGNHGKTAHKWSEISRAAPVSLPNFFRQIYAAATFQLPVKNTVATLILCSRCDRLVSYKSSDDIASFWHKKQLCHDLAGHDLTTDTPDWSVSQLLSWQPLFTLQSHHERPPI